VRLGASGSDSCCDMVLVAEPGRESTAGGWRRSIASCASNESSNERLRKCSSEGTGVDAMMDARVGYLGDANRWIFAKELEK
jgi:hypothetical protein